MKNFRSKKGSVINEEETIKFSFDGNNSLDLRVILYLLHY